MIFKGLLLYYEQKVTQALVRPGRNGALHSRGNRPVDCWRFSLCRPGVFSANGPGQFVINLKMPTGTRVEVSDKYVAEVEREVREVIPKSELEMMVSNIGITPDFSVIYTSNSAMHTAFVQVSLREDHKVGSYEYMEPRAAQLAERSAPAQHLFPIRWTWWMRC